MGDGARLTLASGSAALGKTALGRNVIALGVVSFFTDVSSEMIYPLLPIFLTTVLGASASMIGLVEGAAESTAAFLKLGSGWWSDRVRKRKPLVVAGYTIASAVRPLVAIAASAQQVLAVRVLDRVGKGIRTSPRDALIADSVDPALRGRAYGFHRAADHAGAVVGPLLAFALLRWAGVPMRTVFWLAAVPGAIAVAVLVLSVRDVPRADPAMAERVDLSHPRILAPSQHPTSLGGRFWAYLVVLVVFTLGNSTDAFLLLRARELGVPAALIPILWAVLHVVKSASSTPGGALSDRVGRKPLIVAGWLLYALVYLGFATASAPWHAWALFAVYGVFFGLTEGVEKALVADLVPAGKRGSAFGWFHLAFGLAALPASVIFGVIWDRWGAATAFGFGATMALLATAGVAVVAPARHRG